MVWRPRLALALVPLAFGLGGGLAGCAWRHTVVGEPPAAPRAKSDTSAPSAPASASARPESLAPLALGPWTLSGSAARDAASAIVLPDAAAVAAQTLSVPDVGGRRFRCDVELRADTAGTPLDLSVSYRDDRAECAAAVFEYAQVLPEWTRYRECLVLPETAESVTGLRLRRGPGTGNVGVRNLVLTPEPLRFDCRVRHYAPDGGAGGQVQGPTRSVAQGTAELIYPTDRGAVAPDLFLPLVLGCRSALPRGTRAEVVVDVPAAIGEAQLICAGHPQQHVLTGAAARGEAVTVVDGAEWRRYRAPTDLFPGASDAQALLFVRAALPPGTRTRLGYHLEWAGGAQPTRWLDLDVVRIPQGRLPQRFLFAVHPVFPWEIPAAPGFAELLLRVGLGGVELGDIVNASEWRRATVEHLRTRGVRPIGQFSPVFWYPYATALRRDPDLQAKGLDGKTVPGGEEIAACPSYRGPVYQEQLALLRLWAGDLGIHTVNVDEECFGPGGRICFCDRCRRLFTAYLARHHPALSPVPMEEIARAPDRHPEAAKAWAQLKADLVTEWYRDYRQALVEAWRGLDPWQVVTLNATCQTTGTGAGSGFGTPEFMSIMRDNAARLGSGAVQHLLPMPYCYQEYYDGSLRRVGADLAQLRDLWQPHAPGRKPLFPYILAGGAGMCHLYPQRGLKYQLYEMVATGGVAGGVLWTMRGMDGFHWQHLAAALRAIAAVEDVLWDGTPRALACTPAGAEARALCRGEDAAIVVSHYGYAPVDVEVAFSAERRCLVRDAETGETVAALAAGQPAFRVRIDRERVRLLRVGGR